MNKYFCSFIVLISIFQILSCFKDFIIYSAIPSGEIDSLKSFTSEFPNIKQIGFYSDIEFPPEVMYRIQNTIIPVIVDDSINYNEIFCYSENFICQKNIMSGNAILLKQYGKNLFLLQKPKGVL